MPKFRFPGPLGIPKLGFRGLGVWGFRVWGKPYRLGSQSLDFEGLGFGGFGFQGSEGLRSGTFLRKPCMSELQPWNLPGDPKLTPK